jgi:iron complex transport system substrate-binding protein
MGGPRPYHHRVRVVSLLPSATELLCRLGHADRLVGRSHECDFPEHITDRPVLTAQRTRWTSAADVDQKVSAALAAGESLYHLDIPRLQELRPDLILTQDLCEVCSIDLNTVRQAAAQMDPSPEVLSLDPHALEDVYDDLLRVGRAVGDEEGAMREVVALRERFSRAADHVNPYTQPVTTVFLEWTDPPFVGGHWTPQLIERAGGSHPLNPTEPLPDAGIGAGGQGAFRVAGKSVRVEPRDIVRIEPEALVVCPCGLTLDQVREEVARLQTTSDWFNEVRAVRDGRVALVDGNEMFNRPGPRLVDAFEWLVGWLNGLPQLMPEAFPWEPLEAS